MSRLANNNYAALYDSSKSHHRAWLAAVLERLLSHEPHALDYDSELHSIWQAAIETKAGGNHA